MLGFDHHTATVRIQEEFIGFSSGDDTWRPQYRTRRWANTSHRLDVREGRSPANIEKGIIVYKSIVQSKRRRRKSVACHALLERLIALVRASLIKQISIFFSFSLAQVNPTTHAMAKGKEKRSSDTQETHSEAAVADPASQATPDIPNLDEGAFAGLRQKIEQRLKDQKSGKGKSKDNGKAKTPAVNIPVKKEKQKTDQSQGSAKGKKRDRNGEVIAREEKKGGKNKNNKEDTLRQEILALGGAEEDFDLLAGVDSESEVEDAPSQSKNKGGEDSLRKELSMMLEAAGQVVPPDLADEEVDEGGDDEDEGEDEDGEDSGEPEDSDVDEAPAKPAAPEVKIPKEYAKLVSDVVLDWQANMLILIKYRLFFLDLTGMLLLLLQSPGQSK